MKEKFKQWIKRWEREAEKSRKKIEAQEELRQAEDVSESSLSRIDTRIKKETEYLNMCEERISELRAKL
ncbi:hypothetical protein ACI1UH_06285 [Lactococcus formosensis subsp. bovis]|uniref:hypothetical protein n=1 Tax=Lactococcus formosensis TaxID=1281486 RepID=UPI00030D0DF2